MSFITQLRLMVGITVVGTLIVIVLASLNLSRLRAEFAAYQLVENTHKSLTDIKATALSVTRLDPIVESTAAKLNAADTRIKGLLQGIGDDAHADELAAVAHKWDEYARGFRGAIAIAADSPLDALNIPDAMYKLHLAPMVDVLDRLVDEDTAREQASSARINTFVQKLLWIVLVPLIASGVLVVLVQLSFSGRLHGRMRAITAEINRLNSGDLSRRLPDHFRDEVGELARLINGFIARLEAVFLEFHAAAQKTRLAAQGISQMTESVTASAKAQSEKFFEVSSAIEQMGGSIQDTAAAAGNAAQRVGEALSMVDRGNAAGRLTIGSLGRIDETVSASATTISELEAAIVRIGEVSKAIEGIASRTNLLALNAAIEAARAGEQGRGFAVVADEVRELSTRTAASTSDILEIVQTIQASTGQAIKAMNRAKEEVRQGVAYGEEMGGVLAEIDRSVRSVTELMTRIAAATEEQSAVGRGIHDNVDNVATITAATTERFDSTRSAMGDLVATAHTLHDALAQFRLAA